MNAGSSRVGASNCNSASHLLAIFGNSLSITAGGINTVFRWQYLQVQLVVEILAVWATRRFDNGSKTMDDVI